jgi:hypothetical protein
LLDLQRQVVDSLDAAAAEREELRQAQAAFASAPVAAQGGEEAPAELSPPPSPSLADEILKTLVARLEALESARPEPAEPVRPEPAEPVRSEPAEPVRSEEISIAPGPRPAVFANNGHRRKQVALFAVRPSPRD